MVIPSSPDSHWPAPGSLVDSWIVGNQVGTGAHGVVFRAVHKDRPHAGSYALKLALRAGDERFEREAHLLSLIQHPSVPRLEGRGRWRSHDGEAYPYLVMQWAEGLSPYSWALEHGHTLRQSVRWLAQVTRALEAVHQHGVHRDVKGVNVRVSAEGPAMLLDFGSCWYPEASPLTGNTMPPVSEHYRSPQLLFFKEALEHGWPGSYEAKPADDVYALGVIAYRLLAGCYPPSGSSSDGSTQVAPPEAPRGLNEACPELAELIVRMLSEDDPEARGSANEVAEELEALLEYANPELDKPWRSDASRQPTAKAAPPTPRKPAPPQVPRKPEPLPTPREPVPLPAPREASPPSVPPVSTPPPVPGEDTGKERGPLLFLAGSCLLLVLLGALLTGDVDRGEVASTGPESGAQAPKQPDAGTAVGEEGFASVAPAQTQPGYKAGVTRDLPATPLPGQKRPPCNHRAAVVINGGCWRLLYVGGQAEKAPCDADDEYKYGGRCYIALMQSSVRGPTSEDPP